MIITRVLTAFTFDHAARIAYPEGIENYNTAALAPGEVFVDEERQITITYVSKDAYDNCTVKAELGEINAPDPTDQVVAVKHHPALDMLNSPPAISG